MEFQYTLEGPDSNYTIHLNSADPTSDMDAPTRLRFSTKDHNDRNRPADPNCARDYSGTDPKEHYITCANRHWNSFIDVF